MTPDLVGMADYEMADAGNCLRRRVRVEGLSSFTKIRALSAGDAPSELWQVRALRRRFVRAWSGPAMVTALMAVGGPATWRPMLIVLLIQFLLAGVIIDRLLGGRPADDALIPSADGELREGLAGNA